MLPEPAPFLPVRRVTAEMGERALFPETRTVRHDDASARDRRYAGEACAFGCSSGRSKQRVVRFWAVGREGEVAANAGVRGGASGDRSRGSDAARSAAHEKLLTAFAGDALLDLCQLGNTWVPEFAALKALEPLDGYAAVSAELFGDYRGLRRESNRRRLTAYRGM